MAYYSGQASSYQELQTVLTNACVEQGWTWADGILNKGLAYVKLSVTTNGIIIQGGTGKSGSTLINASQITPRMGTIHATLGNKIAFPLSYNIHVFQNPDELFFILKSNEYYYWLSFGNSNLQTSYGTGMWLSACALRDLEVYTGGSSGGVLIDASGSGLDSYNGGIASSTALFWKTNNITAEKSQDTINCSIHGGQWVGSPTLASYNAYDRILSPTTLHPLLSLLPSKILSDSILMPIQAYVVTNSSKLVMVADLKNARYVRIDNFEPDQILQIGTDKWKIYPFYRKNISKKDGQVVGGMIDHSGTFGWAIRYDGP